MDLSRYRLCPRDWIICPLSFPQSVYVMLLVGQAHSRGKWLSTLAFGGREGVTEEFLDACLRKHLTWRRQLCETEDRWWWLRKSRAKKEDIEIRVLRALSLCPSRDRKLSCLWSISNCNTDYHSKLKYKYFFICQLGCRMISGHCHRENTAVYFRRKENKRGGVILGVKEICNWIPHAELYCTTREFNLPNQIWAL